MTKLEILILIKNAGDELLDFAGNNPKVDLTKLKKVELMSLLGSIRNVETLYKKCQVKGEEEQDDNNRV